MVRITVDLGAILALSTLLSVTLVAMIGHPAHETVALQCPILHALQ